MYSPTNQLVVSQVADYILNSPAENIYVYRIYSD